MVFCSVYPQENTRPVVERQEPRRSNPDRPPGLFPCSRKMGGGRELGDEQLPHLRHCSSIQSRVSAHFLIRSGREKRLRPKPEPRLHKTRPKEHCPAQLKRLNRHPTEFLRPCSPRFESSSALAVLHDLLTKQMAYQLFLSPKELQLPVSAEDVGIQPKPTTGTQ